MHQKLIWIWGIAVAVLFSACGDHSADGDDSTVLPKGIWLSDGLIEDDGESYQSYYCFDTDGKQVYLVGYEFYDEEHAIRWYKGVYLAAGNTLSMSFEYKIVYRGDTLPDLLPVSPMRSMKDDDDTFATIVDYSVSGNDLTVSYSGENIVLKAQSSVPHYFASLPCD